MSLDGLFLHAITTEINNTLQNAKVDKVYQPDCDTIILSFRGYKEGYKLLISANSSIPRIHFIDKTKENPMSPPMFCMLLRKNLIGAKFINATQLDLERAIKISFEAYNDFGEMQNIYLYVEIMGKHSNIILANGENIIMDSIKRVDLSVSTVRQILPNMTYKSPPTQDKVNILEYDFLKDIKTNDKVHKFLLSFFQGFSPLISREIVFEITGNIDTTFDELTDYQKDKLKFSLKKLKQIISEKVFKPVMFINSKTDEPLEFYCLEISQYQTNTKTVEYSTFSKLLENFYEKKDKIQTLHRKEQDILRILSNASDRLTKKIAIHQEDIVNAKSQEISRKYGDILIANLYIVKQGMESIELVDYEDEEQKNIRISLVKEISPSKNAQRYFKIYKKSITTIKEKQNQIEIAKEELNYINTVFDSLTKVETDKEITEIKQELITGKYIKESKIKSKQKKIAVSTSMEFISHDGFKILVGKNNLQNDNITTKIASKMDLWFHIKDYHGSHTVILTGGVEVPNTTIEQAAILATTYSKANSNAKVAVDFTTIKNVKKPNGSKPGMVIYDKYQTIYTQSNEVLSTSLRVK